MIFGFELIVIGIMLILNAIFAAYEMALASISRSRILVLVEEKRKGSKEASFMKDNIEASFAIIQLGITLVGALAAATGGAGVEEFFAPYIMKKFELSMVASKIISLIVLIIPLTYITIVFSELIPKMFALNNKEKVVLALSPLMKTFSLILNPIVYVIEGSVKSIMTLVSKKFQGSINDAKKLILQELKAATSLARSSRVLGFKEERIILSAAHFYTRKVKEIIIPVSDIFTININMSLMDAFLKAHLDMHTRFPVCDIESDHQTIQGYVNFKDIVMALKMSSGEPGIKGIMRPINRIDENITISLTLEKMMQEKAHIALVVSNENKILGMVTLEDIMEELVGEIEDEFDRQAFHIQSYGSSWLMGGGVPITVVVSKFGFDWTSQFKNKKAPTLQEWCAEKKGSVLTGGEVLKSDGICVVPRKFRRKNLIEAIVSLDKN